MNGELVFAKLSTSQVTTEVKDGWEYLVAPIVAVKEKVLNGEYLSAEEIDASVKFWSDVPIAIAHPLKDGEKTSAKELDVIEECVVGRFYHVYSSDKKLKGELWIDVKKAEKLGGDAVEILNRLQKGLPVEVSTAYWSDTSEEVGVFEGQEYVGVQHNLRPDHIALLPESVGKGACSWADGCGVPRINMELVHNPYPNEHSCRLVSPGKFQEEHWSRGTRATDGKKYSIIRGRLKGETTTTEQAFRYPTGTWTEAAARAHCKAHKGIKFEPATGVKTQMELVVQLREGESYEDRVTTVENAIREMVIPDGQADWYTYISDLYENTVVYQVTEPDQERQYFRASYAIDEDLKATIGDAVAVKREVTYTTLQKERDVEKKERDGIVAAMKDGIEKGFNSLKSLITRGGEPMDKEQLIAVLLENDKGLDKELLENADETLLKAMVGLLPVVENEEAPANTTVDPDPTVTSTDDKPKDETPKDNEADELGVQIEAHLQAKYKDFDQIKAHMDTMAAETDAAKKKLVDGLVANKQCIIDKDALEELSPETLRQLDAAFVPGSYLGSGVVKTNLEAIPRPPAILLAVPSKGGE